jgi:protein-L-isoaspartate(D-aspartate) O-methyltransferase
MAIEQARTNMIMQQCRTWGVTNDKILTLLKQTPREYFVPAQFEYLAFADMAVPLAHGQQMLIPKEEAKILDVLNIQDSERVLEIGTGSGYFTALLAKQAKHVESVDIFPDFIEAANKKLSAINIHNVTFNHFDAAAGYKKDKYFDVVVITGSLPFLPQSFLHNVNIGGRLFAFIGVAPVMEAILLTRKSENDWQKETLFETYVLPLINALQPNGFIF